MIFVGNSGLDNHGFSDLFLSRVVTFRIQYFDPICAWVARNVYRDKIRKHSNSRHKKVSKTQRNCCYDSSSYEERPNVSFYKLHGKIV